MPIPQEIIDRTLRSKQGEAAYHLVVQLLDAGCEAWWVGGCVRDMLLERVPQDIDIATDAHPEKIATLFPKSDVGSSHLGTVVISLLGHTFEVTTFREEHEESNGRHPESVAFSTREADAKRRDITINSLYWQPVSGELYDPFEGEKDLSELLVRMIGDPETRIRHDALRLLRVIRFRALIGGQYHPDTYHALHKLSREITVLSGTRHLEELEKMLMGPHPERAYEDLWETDVLEHLIPELYACKGVAQPADYHREGDVWDHTMLCIASFLEDHGADVRFAALLHDVGKTETFERKERIRFDSHASVSADTAKNVLERLQCPRKRIDKVDWLVRHHMMMGTFFEMNDERKAHWYYHPWFTELLQVFWLDIAGTRPAEYDLYDRIIADYNAFLDTHPRPPTPLMNGQEVMDLLGIRPGARVGEAMQQLYDAQVRKEIATRKEAEAYLKSHFSS